MIRKAKPEEAAIIAPLLLEAMPEVIECYTGLTGKIQQLSFLEKSIATDDYLYGYENIWVKEYSNQIMGAILAYNGLLFEERRNAILSTYGQKLNIPAETQAGEFYIDALAVKEESRGKGYGRELILHVMEAAKELEYNKVTILSDQKNTKATDLYLSFDFVKGDVLKIGDATYWKLFHYIRN